jgi:hypothetical protein
MLGRLVGLPGIHLHAGNAYISAYRRTTEREARPPVTGMRPRPYLPPGNDERRVEVISSAITTSGVSEVSERLMRATEAVKDPTAFAGAATDIGVILGFDVTPTDDGVVWSVDSARGRAFPAAGQASIQINATQAQPTAEAAGRMLALLGDLGWRARLPRSVKSQAICWSLSNHRLSTDDLVGEFTESG